MRRYIANGKMLIGGYRDGEFRIGLASETDADFSDMHLLGSGPSLVEALDDALQMAIIVEEDWRSRLTD